MGRLFGTNGVRGVANIDLTPEMVFHLGRAAGYVLVKGKKRGKIIVGKDTRLSGDMLEAAIISGICSVGSDALKVGVLPTPAISFLTKEIKADAGIMISASHNPMEDNGIKFFDQEGFKLKKRVEERIEEFVFEKKSNLPSAEGVKIGKVFTLQEAKEKYLNYLKDKALTNYKGIKVVIDCANGAASETAPQIFKKLGAKTIVLNSRADGTNINLRCGSLFPEVVAEKVLSQQADIGLSFDGDADRVILIDEKGKVLDGDHILTILGTTLKERGELKNNLIVATLMSNLGLEKALLRKGIQLIRTPVGDKNVVAEMKKREAILGGEQAGHIIFLNYNPCGDGILTSLKIINLMVEQNLPLSKLAGKLKRLPQVLINLKVRNKGDFEKVKGIKKIIKEAEREVGEGRVLVRPSGTEPIVRIMVEGKGKEKIKKIAQELAEKIDRELKGAVHSQ